MNNQYLSAIPVLKEKTVITHGDVFPHNVIWHDPNHPFLIDWEAIKKWNPTREAIRTCITWSGVSTNSTNLSLFEKMIKTYINFDGPLEKSHVEAALNGLYGNIINWLLYNIDLLCSGDKGRKDAAINEINACLTLGSKLTELYPILFNSITQIA